MKLAVILIAYLNGEPALTHEYARFADCELAIERLHEFENADGYCFEVVDNRSGVDPLRNQLTN